MLKFMSFALKLTNNPRNLRKIILRLKDRYTQNKDDIFGLSAHLFHFFRTNEEKCKEGMRVFRQDNSDYCKDNSSENASFEKIKDAKRFELSPCEVKPAIREEIELLKKNNEHYKQLRVKVGNIENILTSEGVDKTGAMSDLTLDIMLAKYECKMGRHRLDVIEKLV